MMLRRLLGRSPDHPTEPRRGGTPVADVDAALADLEGGVDQFAVFATDRNRYVQVSILDDGGLYGEAVSNSYLTGSGRIGPEAIETLADLGWSTGTAPNYSRTWPVWTGAARAQVVDDIVGTLIRAYEMPSDGVIDVTTDS